MLLLSVLLNTFAFSLCTCRPPVVHDAAAEGVGAPRGPPLLPSYTYTHRLSMRITDALRQRYENEGVERAR